MTLEAMLSWVLVDGGLGWLCSVLISWLDDHWFAFAALRPDLKRLASFGITAGAALLLGALVLGAQIAMRYSAGPQGWREWVEVLVYQVSLACWAIVTGQVRHGEAVLRKGAAE